MQTDSSDKPSNSLTLNGQSATASEPALSTSANPTALVTRRIIEQAPAKAIDKTYLLLGEFPVSEDLRSRTPFMSSAGTLLRKDLFPNAGLNYHEWHKLYVFQETPPKGDLKNWTLNKTEWKRSLGGSPPDNPPPLAKRYLHPDHYWQLEELKTRLDELQPDFIICLGATALWAVTGEYGIANFRGTIFPTKWGSAIATYHPAAVQREWSFRPICWADLSKAALWLRGELPAPLRREIWINPTWEEIDAVYQTFLANPSWTLGVDIETCPSIDQITTISFSTPTLGICIPIWDRHAADPAQASYWKTPQEEVRAWRWIERFCKLPNPKVAQNGLYDTQYCLDAPVELRFRNLCDDTAILQHSLQPELPKALGFLSSLYLNEPSWKQMRGQAKDAKVDE